MPSTFSQLLRLDRLHGLEELGADPFVMRKTNFPSFGTAGPEVQDCSYDLQKRSPVLQRQRCRLEVETVQLLLSGDSISCAAAKDLQSRTFLLQI